MKDFNYISNIKDVQNRIIAQSIRDSSNLQLAKTEEAIKSIIQSYVDRFKSVEGMLTDVTQYLVKSEDIIRVELFNKLFESIFIDFSSLYSDLESIDNVLNLNLHRNKTFYLNIKKHVRDLWNQVYLLKDSISDQSLSTESFYESFQTTVNSKEINNLAIDKKTGILHLIPIVKEIYNKSFNIKNITSTTYPCDNPSGGVIHAVDPLNSLDTNYALGTRDILENGLWKEEIICNDIPSMIINIGSTLQKLYKDYTGIVSIVDIEFSYPIHINRFDIDVFGNSSLDIDTIMIKNSESDDWSPLFSSSGGLVSGSGFDVITFMNIKNISCRFLRIVFNQRHYSILSQTNDSEFDIDKQIQNDLSERRYELVSFDKNIYNFGIPNNKNNMSLYNKIISIIETTRDINTILTSIEKILIPDLKTDYIDFPSSYKYEMGTWSIEPSYEVYSSSKGYLVSKDYGIKDGCLTSVSLKSKQSTPLSTTCNWYIKYNGKNIPIVDNTTGSRKERLHFIDVSRHLDFSKWPGSFAQLDFPVNPQFVDNITLYENGRSHLLKRTELIFLNSRLIYLPEITNSDRFNYVISYNVPLFRCVNLWTLTPSMDGPSFLNDIPLGLVSSRRDILQSFIRSAQINVAGGSDTYLSSYFNIENCVALQDEAVSWFGVNFTTCLFISSEVYDKGLISFTSSSRISTMRSKMSGNFQDINTYISGSSTPNCDYSLVGNTCNLIFPNIERLL